MPGCEDQFPLTEPQSRQLIGAILDAIETHGEVHGRPIRWAAFQDMLPEALRYPPELLREMTRRCAVFGLLRGYSDHGEAFSTEGLTALGRFGWSRQQGKSTRHRLATGLLFLGELIFLYLALTKTR
ncbi:MAG: hypothetical protein GXX99_08430 [Clostridiales bacterium]|nr:hypothetical protein [Clostridiales bacterium]